MTLRTLVGICIVCFLGGPNLSKSAFAQSQALKIGETAFVDCRSLKSVELLSSPSQKVGSVLLKNLRCGERVTILSMSDSWARIRTDSNEEGFAVVYFLSREIAYSNFSTAKTPANVSALALARADAKPKPPVLSFGTGFLVHPDGLLVT